MRVINPSPNDINQVVMNKPVENSTVSIHRLSRSKRPLPRSLLVDIVLGIVDREFSGRRHQALILDYVLEFARFIVDYDDR